MVCAKIKPLIAAMTASCMTPQEIAKEAGVSVNIVYRMAKRVYGEDGPVRVRLQSAWSGSGKYH